MQKFQESSSSIEWEETSRERMSKQDPGWASMRRRVARPPTGMPKAHSLPPKLSSVWVSVD